jgi:hypothetical protein
MTEQDFIAKTNEYMAEPIIVDTFVSGKSITTFEYLTLERAQRLAIYSLTKVWFEDLEDVQLFLQEYKFV